MTVNRLQRTRETETKGIAISNFTNSMRFLFFEIDITKDKEIRDRIIDVYRRFGLDLLVHRSGNGWHFISPTLINLDTWKLAMCELTDINERYPAISLRLEPNKYVNEGEVWNLHEWFNFNHRRHNSIECVAKLNSIWPIPNNVACICLLAVKHTELKLITYPFKR